MLAHTYYCKINFMFKTQIKRKECFLANISLKTQRMRRHIVWLCIKITPKEVASVRICLLPVWTPFLAHAHSQRCVATVIIYLFLLYTDTETSFCPSLLFCEIKILTYSSFCGSAYTNTRNERFCVSAR